MSENTVELRVTERERDLIVRALEEHRTKRSSQGLSSAHCDALLPKVMSIDPNDLTSSPPDPLVRPPADGLPPAVQDTSGSTEPPKAD